MKQYKYDLIVEAGFHKPSAIVTDWMHEVKRKKEKKSKTFKILLLLKFVTCKNCSECLEKAVTLHY